MANIILSNLPTYTGNTDGVYVVMNDSGNTTTYKVTKENLSGTSGSSGSSGTSGSSGSSGIFIVGWTNYSPTLEGSTTAPTKAIANQEGYMYQVVDKTLYLKGYYYHNFATGTAGGSGDYLIPLPSGYTINTSVCPAIGTSNNGITLGYCHVEQDGAIGVGGAVKVYDSTRIKFVSASTGSLKNSVSSGWFNLTINNYELDFSCEIPIN